MTSFDIAALVPELNRATIGARIDNVYQIDSVTFLLKFRQPSQPPLHLLFEAGKRIHLTSYILKKPLKPPAFCMALRKHLKNGRVTGIQQHEFERIVVIKVGTREGEFQLISELFGEGNLILVGPQNIILHALVYRRMRDRNVLRGEVFQHAPPSGRNPLVLSRQEFGEIKLLGRLEVVRGLTRFLSIGGLYAEEILLRAQVEKNVMCESLTENEMDRVFEQLKQILSVIIAGNISPHVVVDEKVELVDVVPIPLKKYAGLKQKPYMTFSEALDEYYVETTMKGKAIKVAKEVDRKLTKQQRILQRQQEALEELKEKEERNRRVGDTIFAHLGELQLLLQKIMDEKSEGKLWEQIVLSMEKEREAGHIPAFYFHSLEPQRLTLQVSVENLVFPLDLRRSVQASAADYYAKAKRAESKLKGVEEALQETQDRIKELQRQRTEQVEETAKPPIKKRKKAWYEKFRWFRSSEGFLVVGGRDAATNEALVKKHMEPHDIVFHADIPGAPFVLIKTEGKAPTEQTIRESAQFAASYSRAWRDALGAVDVYWVTPQQVSKSPPTGLYLKRGAFMIHGSRNYLRKVPLELAIGVMTVGEQPVVVGGPADAVSKQTSTYVEIVPGEHSSHKLAEHIRHLIAENVSRALQKRVFEIPIEEIQGFIPLGKGAVRSKS